MEIWLLTPSSSYSPLAEFLEWWASQVPCHNREHTVHNSFRTEMAERRAACQFDRHQTRKGSEISRFIPQVLVLNLLALFLWQLDTRFVICPWKRSKKSKTKKTKKQKKQKNKKTKKQKNKINGEKRGKEIEYPVPVFLTRWHKEAVKNLTTEFECVAVWIPFWVDTC